MLFEKKRKAKWVEAIIYNAEHVELPQIYFGMKNEGSSYSPQRFCDMANFLLARALVAADGMENFADASERFHEEHKFEVTEQYVKIICQDPTKYAVSKAPLAYVIYAENIENRYIVKEYDPELKSVWCEWRPGRNHLTYHIDPELCNCSDDEIHDMILHGASGVIPALTSNH